MTVAYRGPNWLNRLAVKARLPWFDRVVALNLGGDIDAEKDLRRLLQLPYLEELQLSEVSVTDETIESFRHKFPNLQINRTMSKAKM